jgi:hypothetical protein
MDLADVLAVPRQRELDELGDQVVGIADRVVLLVPRIHRRPLEGLAQELHALGIGELRRSSVDP